MIDITLTQALVLALAVYRVCRLIIEDNLTEPLRDLVWRRFPPSTRIGYYLTCYWCTGVWVSSFTIFMYTIVPSQTFTVALILALSSVAGLIAARSN